ncbi:ELMO/CED-12 family-domain-containing protein [Phycomyces blakesleeanus]|uniref:ELMO domain-containing protein n=2 Tax=Phycomyces blakesleeanus TaxID=4837 RepID=A0A162WXV4_PHYB8|nr:hypothetical protein PHYBLDRAFT_72059 [Phycomyces blakesleeanus NRRL 1555(-)]OAD71465.1 hypothetical protein PHYBLDRAFT_72059 [Phycomyces blakesleeanus NRRL 1555(-)]|eukprot:XP_018289505.1 hypothetical protein PHYBLDRAFT_72059 [Phycomyces blakesleeanus NRRL 1555(-)]
MGWLTLLFFNKVYQIHFALAIYKAYKRVARLFTHTTEMYRICHSATILIGWTSDDMTNEDNSEQLPLLEDEKYNSIINLPPMTICRIEKSLMYSKILLKEQMELTLESCNVDEVVDGIRTKKGFPVGQSPELQILKACVSQIAEYFALVRQIKAKTSTVYSIENPAHEEQLLTLWSALMPNVKLESRHTRQWIEIGFQGSDPATDFRGMGIQGLDDLVYYSSRHSESALTALKHSMDGESWYPFAIVGINITQYAVRTLESRRLQSYLYRHGSTIKSYQEFYSYLFHTFDAFWINHQPPLTVMDFEMAFGEFKAITDAALEAVVPLDPDHLESSLQISPSTLIQRKKDPRVLSHIQE